MRSPGINGEGELRGQPASPGSPGKMAVKTVCVNRTTIPSPNSVKSTKGNAYKFFQCFNTVGLTSESASDMGYLCANFSLIRPICSQLRPDVRGRQTYVRRASSLNVPCSRGGGIIILCVKHVSHINCYWLVKFLFSFLPHDAMRCPTSVRPSVCLSLCLSVTFVHSIQTAEDIIKRLCRPVSSIILVFDLRCQYQIPREPLQRRRKIQGVGKFCDFRRKLPSILETVRDRPIIAMEC